MALAAIGVPELRSVSEILAGSAGRLVVSGTSKDPNGKVTLVELDADGRPATVFKVAPTPGAEAALAAEAALLDGLDRARLGVLAPTIPETFGWAQHEGRLALVISGLPGRNMLVSYHSWRHTARPASVAADFQSVNAWLAAFQSATAGIPLPLAGQGQGEGSISLADQTIAPALQARFAELPLLAQALDLLAQVQAPLDRYDVPACAVHGDLWAGNILETDGAVTGVVDWEAGRLHGSPTTDPVRYALTYALYLDKHAPAGSAVAGHHGLNAGAWGAGFRHLLAGGSWFSDAAASFIRSALDRLGADPRLWRLALVEGLAGIAATADDPDFARRHLEVFAELAPGALRAGRGET